MKSSPCGYTIQFRDVLFLPFSFKEKGKRINRGEEYATPSGSAIVVRDAVTTKMRLLQNRTGANARVQILHFVQNDNGTTSY
jgi:hypothetical protein